MYVLRTCFICWPYVCFITSARSQIRAGKGLHLQKMYRTDQNSERIFYFRFSLFWCGYYSNFMIFYLINCKKIRVYYSTASTVQVSMVFTFMCFQNIALKNSHTCLYMFIYFPKVGRLNFVVRTVQFLTVETHSIVLTCRSPG